jgi:hypothetical protein
MGRLRTRESGSSDKGSRQLQTKYGPTLFDIPNGTHRRNGDFQAQASKVGVAKRKTNHTESGAAGVIRWVVPANAVENSA